MPKHLADPKRCTKCGDHKPRTEFYPHSVAPLGVSAWCRVCTNETTKANQKANAAGARLSSKKSRLKVKWGMTLSDFDQRLAAQGGGCAICGTHEPGGKGRFHVDHDHKTGAIRGLLCTRCNVGLGQFKDSASALSRAIEYLKGGTLCHP